MIKDEKTPISMARLLVQIDRVPEAGERAIEKWGAHVQIMKAREEMGELQTAMARWDQGAMGHRTGRVRLDEIAEEAADVIITAMQVGLISVGRVGFEEALRRKLDKLSGLLSQREVAGG